MMENVVSTTCKNKNTCQRNMTMAYKQGSILETMLPSWIQRCIRFARIIHGGGPAGRTTALSGPDHGSEYQASRALRSSQNHQPRNKMSKMKIASVLCLFDDKTLPCKTKGSKLKSSAVDSRRYRTYPLCLVEIRIFQSADM